MLRPTVLKVTGSYQTAVALNNAGVHLLESGSLLHAHETISDSLAVLQRALGDVDEEIENDRWLEAAASRMLKSQHPSLSSAKTKALSLDPSSPMSCSILDAVQSLNMSIGWISLRIQLNDPEKYSCGLADIHAAIILYNVGVASYFLSQAEGTGHDSSRHLKNAYQLFYLSIQLCLRDDKGEEHDVEYMGSHLVVAFLAVRAILQLADPLLELGCGHAHKFLLLFGKLKERISRCRVSLQILSLAAQCRVAPAA